MKIPNSFPLRDGPSRIAFIGVAPDKEDAKCGVPFNSTAGRLVRDITRQYQVDPTTCFYGNLNEFYTGNQHFSPASAESQISVADLRRDLQTFRPNIVVLLGKPVLSVSGRSNYTIDEYRGSLFVCTDPNSPFYSYKCVASYDPADALKLYERMPLLRFDLRRACKESLSPDLTLPKRTYEVALTAEEILSRLDSLPARIAVDIEGGIPNPSATTPRLRFPRGITCLSIAISPDSAFIIPFHVHSLDDTVRIILKLREVMANPLIGKILQNGLYDAFALAWTFHILIVNIDHDTMLSGFERYPELPKSLAVQTSIYTREPFYKDEMKVQDDSVHFTYCCKDACVTFEIALEHERSMSPSQLDHFRFNMQMIPIILYMQLRGISYDREQSNLMLAKTQHLQNEISQRIHTRLNTPLNINSPKQLSNVLYNILNFPKQHPPKKTGFGLDKTKLSTSVDSILDILQTHESPILHEILAWRRLDKMRQSLSILSDRDGRVRSSYNPVGTETGRLSCSKSPTGRGANLQTITKKLRMHYGHEPDQLFWQVDLAGADGWTVAAHCAKMGDPTMLDDYLFGIKPARVIGLMYLRGSEVSQLDRPTLARESKVVGEGDTEWLYFACKQVQHGTNYLLGVDKMSKLIAKQSYKLLGRVIRVSPTICKQLQGLYLVRYKGVKIWQDWVGMQIRSKGALECASGHTRIFFGRRNDASTHREACSQEPQHNTTYVTNRALINLWLDPDNRNPDGSLIIAPLHQVHDAGCGLFPPARTEWAVSKLHSYFNFSIQIANQPIHIPFEGEYGNSWGHKLGNI